MTPSPSPTPPSSHSSHPISSSISPEGTPRPSLVSRALPTISQVSRQLDLVPHSQSMGASGPNVPAVLGESTELSRHVKDKPTQSESTSSETAHPVLETWPEAPEQEPEAGTSSLSRTDPPRHQSKKKRTRTLTTPHQSAVLHALLAQSRFPTTAMREEVGRSIGLSARKVQVWFQNQRQKARKPRQPGSTPADRQPQYGAFTSGSSTDPGSEPGPSGVSGTFQGIDPMGRQSPYVAEPSSSSAHPREFSEYSQARTPAQEHHLHSGVPYGIPSTPPTRGAEGSFTPPSTFFPIPTPHYPFHPLLDNPPDLYPRPPLPRPPLMRSDSPIVLPPLRFDQPHTGQFQGNLPPPPLPDLDLRNMPPSASFPGLSPSEVSSSSSSILPSPYSITTQPPSRHGEPIPPPFTLQPEPQWDPPHPGPRPMLTLHPPVGPVQSTPFSQAAYSRHRTYSDPTRTLPPLSGHSLEQPPPLGLQPWPLSTLRSDPISAESTSMSAGGSTSMRRYDPIRSAVSQGQREEEVEVEDRSGSTRYAQGSGQGYYHQQQDTGGDVARRNRHTYDFGRPSERMSMSTPPRRSGEPEQEEEEEEEDQETAEASRGGGSYTLPPPLPPPPPR